MTPFFTMPTMKNAIYIIMLVLWAFESTCQINLVANPSFEILSNCPSNYGQISKANGWNILSTGRGGTPDLYSDCSTQPFSCGVPSNISGASFQFPKNGSNYAGISCTGSNIPTGFREYIQYSLANNLIPSKNYCVKFYANLSNHSSAKINTLGAYFDNGTVLALISHGMAYADSQQTLIIPQIYNSTNILGDTLQWMLIEGSFTATGNENYLTIGNFFPDSLSNIIGSSGNWHSYYYIDDISVIDISTPAHAGNDTILLVPDTVYLGRPSEIGLDESCIWFLDGVPIDTAAGIWVVPDSTSTYVLQQTLCGNVQYDTVTVTVDTGTGVERVGKQEIRVFPNPSGGEVWYGLDNEGVLDIEVFGMDGKVVYQERGVSGLKNNKIGYSFDRGVYVVVIRMDGRIFREKVVVVVWE